MNSNKRMIELYQEREEGFELEWYCEVDEMWKVDDPSDTLQVNLNYRKVDKKMQCAGGTVWMDSLGNIEVAPCSSERFRIKGCEFTTIEEAEVASKERTKLAIINNIITQENKKEGYVLDWNNNIQAKYYIIYNHSSAEYTCDLWYNSSQIGHITTSRGIVKRVCEWLNKGMIEGIE